MSKTTDLLRGVFAATALMAGWLHAASAATADAVAAAPYKVLETTDLWWL